MPSKVTYVRLGNSGLKVSRIILGCMSYGSPEWQAWVLPEEEGIKHIKAAYDAGINTFDTANVYSNGVSEQHNLPREDIVVLTKVFFPVGKTPGENTAADPFINKRGLSRKHIFDSIKASLERLQLDYVDVLQCHRFDYDTPIEETMQALHDVVKAGYTRYIGMSSCFAYQSYAIQNKLTPFISMQNNYSLAYREEEREMFPTLKHFGVGSIPWSPLARGLLSRPVAEQSKRAVVNRVEEIAKKKNVKMAQIALAWVLHRDGVSAPIIGTTTLDNLYELIDALDIQLSEEEMKSLEEPYLPRAIVGHT
ncbi:aryl-alcohol dehydrogenase [Gymnopus androsaceus JB14]|uniref:Aryl-alcohol dehydrogenase n=1 Tax=Gymnopus androsaceus JB14 TaxID=1447944 RepID=A0A6A4I6W2_9AGAR|nr:aryl-alcohol dehydrogenase [Gymnopus androsaceus JB14]